MENIKRSSQAYEIIKEGGIILYPTDTVGIGCDATNPEAVTKIFKLKKSKTKHDCFDERERMMYNVFKDIPGCISWIYLKTLPLLFWTTLETWL
jgi:L-threonylcarbamoyladenylate synthase